MPRTKPANANISIGSLSMTILYYTHTTIIIFLMLNDLSSAMIRIMLSSVKKLQRKTLRHFTGIYLVRGLSEST